MKLTNILWVAGCLFAGALLPSCSQEEPLASDQEDAPVHFDIDTRVVEPVAAGTTYRIMLYNGNENTSKFTLARTGTYYLKNAAPENGRAELTACRLDDDGTNPVDDETAGLNGANGSFDVVFVSPGVRHNPDGSFSINPRTEKFVASERPERKDIGAYGRVSMSNPMKEYRAMIGINFYKANNPSVDAFEISDLKLVGAGAADEAVTFFPISRQVVAAKEGALAIGLTDRRDGGETDSNGNLLCYETQESGRVAVVPAIYAPKQEVAEILNTTFTNNLRESDYLYMTCTMKQGSRDNIAIRIPLTSREEMRELLPQRTYLFRLITSSNYINLEVDVFDHDGNDWEDGGSEGGTIETPEYTVTLGTWQIVGDGNDWELIPIDDQIIGQEQ